MVQLASLEPPDNLYAKVRVFKLDNTKLVSGHPQRPLLHVLPAVIAQIYLFICGVSLALPCRVS
jgi:hypothetical protein